MWIAFLKKKKKKVTVKSESMYLVASRICSCHLFKF